MFVNNECRGYTIIELIMALAIGSLLVAAATATYMVQNRVYITQESVSEVNTQAKISHDIVADEIKGAGFGWPLGLDLDETLLAGQSFMTPSNDTTATDAVTILGGLRYVGMFFQQGQGINTLPCPSLPDTYQIPPNLNIAIVSPSGEPVKVPLGQIISIDAHLPKQVTTCTTDSNGICTNPGNLGIDSVWKKGFPMWDTDGDNMCDRGRPVYVYEDHTYCVDAGGTFKRIRRGANPAQCTGTPTSAIDELAENIEDLQITYALDADNDGIIDEQDAVPGFDEGDFISVVAANDRNAIKAVRINILAKTDRGDPNYEGQGNPPSVIEDRNHTATNDNFRRRWLRSMVKIRNR
jgi:prepilin-type N-terminal cleavage/methylation domain-containing protein